MNIDEAIKFKETYLRSPLCNLTPYERAADQMSIEALKLRRDEKAAGYLDGDDLLPGETKD